MPEYSFIIFTALKNLKNRMHFKQIHMWKLLLIGFITSAPVLGIAQNRNPNPPTSPTNGQTQPPVTAPTPRTGPKPYKDVITDKAITDEGLFKVHKVDDKYYFEIPDSLRSEERRVGKECRSRW